MPKDSAWEELSLHFKLRYDLGYRYLDRCGELMIILERDHGFMPSETVPAGAKIELPEARIYVEFDTTEMRIRQESPHDHGKAMIESANLLTRLILEYFEPAITTSAGFAAKSYRLVQGEEQVNASTISVDGELHNKLAEELGVNAQSQVLHHIFQSGSYLLQVDLKPVAINTPQRKTFTPGFNPTERQKKLVDRKNSALESLPGPMNGYALLLEVDLREQSPASKDFSEHFQLMNTYRQQLEKRYI